MKADIGAINVLHCEERLPEGQVDHDAARGTNRPSPPDQGSRTADRTVISLRQIKPSPDLELRPQRLLPMAPRVHDAYAAAREVTLVARRERHVSRGCDGRDLSVHRINCIPCAFLGGHESAVHQRRLNIERQDVISHLDEKGTVGLLQGRATSPTRQSFKSVGDLGNSDRRREQLGRPLCSNPRCDRCIRPSPHELARDIGIENDHERLIGRCRRSR